VDGTANHYVKQSQPGAERWRFHAISLMWKLAIQGKCIQKHTWLYKYILNMFVIGGPYEAQGGGRRGKESNWEWTVLKYTASVCEDDITKCTESFWIIRSRGQGMRV
jgi:hypothetical protein